MWRRSVLLLLSSLARKNKGVKAFYDCEINGSVFGVSSRGV